MNWDIAAYIPLMGMEIGVTMVEIFRPTGDQAVFAEALPMAVVMLRMVSLYLFSIVLVIVFIGALRGAGDTLWAMGYHVSLHAVQGWMCVVGTFMCFSVFAWLRYRQGKWRVLR